jgi:methyl-accepting chemotaxis protein
MRLSALKLSFVCISGLLLSSSVALSQPTAKPSKLSADSDELTSQDREVLAWANAMSSEITQTLERWINSHESTEQKLFSRLYYPIPKTDPIKYTTDYDSLADRDLSPIQEKYLNKSDVINYAVTADVNGYVPSHNKKYSMPLTGNKAVDLLNSRSKRLFGDRTGSMAARNEAPYLLQQYKRDTGELMGDLSVPIIVKGRHWGCVRIGYRRLEKP